MLKFSTGGTLGDTYIVVCKLLQYGDKSIDVFHYTRHKYWYDKIREIYSLLPNITVFTADRRYKKFKNIPINCHDGKMEFFPNWDIKSKFNIKDPYIVLQPHSGKEVGGNMKKFNYAKAQKFIDNYKGNVVVLGTNVDYTRLVGCENLIGKTSVKDAMFIISKSVGFIGPEGLLSLVALSQKIKSVVYYTDRAAISLRIINTPWEKYCELKRGLL